MMIRLEYDPGQWYRLAMGMALSIGLAVEAQMVPVSSLGRSLPEASLGETLISELNCVACHSASEVTGARLSSKMAPRLGREGVPLTPQFIRAYLNDPHTEGMGRTMPDVLHGLAPDEKETVIESLVHYLISQQGDGLDTKTGLDEFKLENGRQLFHSVGCVACHLPQETTSQLAEASIPAPVTDVAAWENRMAGDAIPIGRLATKTSVAALAHFLQNPLASRPSGRMPSFNLSPSEATAIAMYLARGQATGLFDSNQPLEKTPGLRYTYIELRNSEHPADGNEDFIEHYPGNPSSRARQAYRVAGSGVASDVSPKYLRRLEHAGLLFQGSISIRVPGKYTFYTRSDDGSRLYVGSKLVVRNDGDHSPQERSGTIELGAGDHPFKISFYNASAGAELVALFEGPGISKQPIPADRFSYLGQSMVPLEAEAFGLDAEKAQLGRRHFVSYGCVQCHETGDTVYASSEFATELVQLGAALSSGCLSREPTDRASKFLLRESERVAIRYVLRDSAALSSAHSEGGRVHQTLTQLNCFACHERDGVGGPTVERASYFGTTTEVDLGDEGRLPPHLNQVGAKLRPDWTRKVLTNGGAVRPYMATRMPQFGEANVGHLPHLFDRVEDPEPDDPTAAVSLMDTKYGRRLLGTKGMACITCHTFGPFPSLGIPAIDLTQMSHRLKRSWFRDYLIDPASLRPGTRMPSFFPGGRSVNEEVFGGDAERQIQAMWGFLEVADASNPPDGLVQGRKEIVAETEAVIYRNFIEGSGSRSIGVGYPEKGNLSFDAAAMRLAMIWQGPFIDGARHSSGRGQGFEPPLGHNRLSLPEGPPLAILPDRQVPWPAAVGTAGGYEFKGYRLDRQRRPTFLYTFRNIEVEDYPVAVETELDATFHRTLRFRSKSQVADVWMRVAVANSIELTGDGWFQVGEKLRVRLKLREGSRAIVRDGETGAELLAPVALLGGEGTIEMDLVW